MTVFLEKKWLWLGILLLGYLATGFYQVRPGEIAVVRRCGRVLPETSGPGLHWGLPWGIDQVDRVAVDERRQIMVGFVVDDNPNLEYLPLGQVLTGDNHLLNVHLSVYYRVDPRSVAAFMLLQDRIDPLLARWAEEGMVLALASERIDPVLLGEAHQLEARMQTYLGQAAARLGLGVRIEQINIQSMQPPEELVEVYREVNRARTQRDIAEREALGQKHTEISLARQDAARTQSESISRANDKRLAAQAEADRFLYWLKRLPQEEAPRRMAIFQWYLGEMQTVWSRMQVRTVSDLPLDQTIIQPGK